MTDYLPHDRALAETGGTTDEATASKVVDLLREARFAMLVSIATDGELLSRPMAIQQVDDDGRLWFFVGLNSDQTRAVQADPRVNVAVSQQDSWVSVAGHAELSQDRAMIDRLWSAPVQAWFPGGKDDPDVALLRVEAHSAEYWDSPGGRVSTLISFVKATVAGERMEGDNAATDMP